MYYIVYLNPFINLVKSKIKNLCNQRNQENPVLDKIRFNTIRYNSFLLFAFRSTPNFVYSYQLFDLKIYIL